MYINKPAAAIAAAFALMATGAQAGAWETVVKGKREQVDIDVSRIVRGEDGKALAWTRLTLAKSVTDPETGTPYNVVEALNSYDCAGSRFATVKRLYLRGDSLLRVEPLLAPREMTVGAGGIDAALMAEACKPRTVADYRKAAEMAARLTAEVATPKPGAFGVMHAEMVTDGASGKGRAMQVADHGTGKPDAKSSEKVPEKPAEKPGDNKSAAASPTGQPAAAEPPAGPRRFIELPKIDKSQLERPSDAAKPAEKAGERAAMPEDRQSRERILATSGPRRAPKPKAPPVPPPAVEVHRDIHWSYEGDGSPANWNKLRPDYATCAQGKRQSPIDIRDTIKVDQESIRFDYKPSLFRIVDNGHTIQVTVAEGNTLAIMGRTYELQQFHFHKPSEEKINGKGFDMVVHLVHRDDEGHLAVVAVLLEKGAEQPLIQTLWNNMPLEVGQELVPATPIDLNRLLPQDRSYFSYMGSLTTPPCTEGVLWLVFRQPQQVSPEQVAVFSKLYRYNARPVQPGNGRLIKESR